MLHQLVINYNIDIHIRQFLYTHFYILTHTLLHQTDILGVQISWYIVLSIRLANFIKEFHQKISTPFQCFPSTAN